MADIPTVPPNAGPNIGPPVSAAAATSARVETREPIQGSGAAIVTDKRQAPRGVMPRGLQTWLLVGLAAGMMLIIIVAGSPEPPARPVSTPNAAAAPPTPDRVRDYQDRLRALDARAMLEAQAAAATPEPVAYDEPQSPPPEDPIEADRRRREYESLFASNVVLSRRPEGDRPDSSRPIAAGGQAEPADRERASIEEIAEAVVRATQRAGAGAVSRPSGVGDGLPAGAATPSAASDKLGRTSNSTGRARSAAATIADPDERPTRTEPISAAGPLHRVLEGTIIDTVLTNRLDGSTASPVNCLVTNPLYSHSGQHVLIPAGSRVLGETRPVQTFGDARLAVSFHRLLLPDGSTVSLDQFIGLNQIGDSGLRDQVNRHYWSTFGAAGAVGLISGLAQYLGTFGLGRGSGDRTVIIAGSSADATAQATLQVMNRFLNRLPTITIREGHRVKVYLTSDIDLPEFRPPTGSGLGEGREP